MVQKVVQVAGWPSGERLAFSTRKVASLIPRLAARKSTTIHPCGSFDQAIYSQKLEKKFKYVKIGTLWGCAKNSGAYKILGQEWTFLCCHLGHCLFVVVVVFCILSIIGCHAPKATAMNTTLEGSTSCRPMI